LPAVLVKVFARLDDGLVDSRICAPTTHGPESKLITENCVRPARLARDNGSRHNQWP